MILLLRRIQVIGYTSHKTNTAHRNKTPNTPNQHPKALIPIPVIPTDIALSRSRHTAPLDQPHPGRGFEDFLAALRLPFLRPICSLRHIRTTTRLICERATVVTRPLGLVERVIRDPMFDKGVVVVVARTVAVEANFPGCWGRKVGC